MVPALRAALLGALPLIGIAWLIDLPQRLGLAFVTAEFLCLMTGLVVAAGLLRRPLAVLAGLPDLILALAALGAWCWAAWNYSDWLLDVANRGPQKWLPGALGLLLLLEALRRNCGSAIALLVAAVALYGFLGHLLPGVLGAAYTAPTRLVLYLYADSNGVPGLVLAVASTVVLGFLLFGKVLAASGGLGFFTDLALGAMGHRRGGPAKVSVVASSIFGTLSGSTVGNIMGTGIVTIPLMKRFGFAPHYAAAVEAVASNGGQLAPPVMGATAFLIAEFLQIDYTEVVLAALAPAALYYLALFAQVDAYAAVRGLEGQPRSELPKLRPTLAKGWRFLLPLALLVYLLFGLGYNPGKTALLSAALAFVLGGPALWRPLAFARLACEGGESLVPVLLVSAAAGVVVGVMNISGLGFSLTLILSQTAGAAGLLAMLALTAVIAMILGMGMPTAAVYVVLSVVLGPALVEMGVPPLAAHLFIFYYGLLSMITPPVAIASFAAAGLAGADFWRTGVSGLRLASAAYLLPFIFCFNPALLLDGGWPEIAVALATAGGSVLLLARALAEGTGGVRLAGLERPALIAATLGLATAPFWAGAGSGLAFLLGAGTLAVPFARRLPFAGNKGKGRLP